MIQMTTKAVLSDFMIGIEAKLSRFKSVMDAQKGKFELSIESSSLSLLVVSG